MKVFSVWDYLFKCYLSTVRVFMYGFVVIIKNVCYVICFTWTEIALHFVNNLFMTTAEYAYKCGAKFSSNISCNICYRPTGRRQNNISQ